MGITSTIFDGMDPNDAKLRTSRSAVTRVERLREIMQAEYEGKQVLLAAKLGRQPDYISRLFSGRKSLGADLAREFELLLGKPAFYLDNASQPNALPDQYGHVVAYEEGDPTKRLVRKVRLKLTAGIMGFAVEPIQEDSEPLAFKQSWFDSRGYKPDKLIAIEVEGQSMEPRLFAGDTVVINTADTSPKDGQVYAVNYEGESVVKRLVRDSGHWWLSSDNPDKTRFQNKKCESDMCIIIGKVVFRQSEQI